MSAIPERSMVFDRIRVPILESNEKLGQRVADDVGARISDLVKQQGKAAMIMATGNSQLTFIEALRRLKDVPWDKVTLFHMDEYLGMSNKHAASFARFIREEVADHVHPAIFHPIRGDAQDVNAELERYRRLLHDFPPDICVMGIGENGHLAFNDPPADYATKQVIHVVNLDSRCRMQQVGEGHFTTLDEVPTRAYSLTVPALLDVKYALVVVPELRKAEAVKAALRGPVTPNCPASILRTRSNVTLYLDRESASLLQ